MKKCEALEGLSFGPAAEEERVAVNLLYGVLLGCIGFAINWFKLELFFNVDFLFGSIVTMYALMRYGTLAGVTAAVIAGSCTWHHWHHIYAIIIFACEAGCTGYLRRKRRWDAIFGDITFWLSGGFLLVLVFYQLILGFSFPSALMMAVKQGANGVLNTLLASAIFLAYRYKKKGALGPPSLYQLLYITTSVLMVLPACVFLFVNLRFTLHKKLAEHRVVTAQVAESAQKAVSIWLERNSAVLGKAAAAGLADHEHRHQLQLFLDTTRLAVPEFKALRVVDDAGTMTSSPRISEPGVAYGTDLGATVSSAVKTPPYRMVAATATTPGARIVFAAPAASRDGKRSTVYGVTDVDGLKQLLQTSVRGKEVDVTLVDEHGRVVASTTGKRRPLDPFTLPKNGRVQPVSGDVGQWIPDQQPGVSAAKRWDASFYLKEAGIGSESGWKVVAEASLKPTLVQMRQQTSLSMAAIGALLLLMISLSRLISSKLSAIFSDFEGITRQIPAKIMAGDTIEWPEAATSEILGLTESGRTIVEIIRQSHNEMQQLNATLEQRVKERSKELELKREQLQKFNDTLAERVRDELRKNREKDHLMLQQDKLASIGLLASGVAHEINNPIGFVMSNLCTLQKDLVALKQYLTDVEQTATEFAPPVRLARLKELRDGLDIEFIVDDVVPLVSESQEGAERVKEIVLALKDFARTDDNVFCHADLNQCIRSTARVVGNELKYVAELDLQLGDIPEISCNPQQINQVIANLLVNAAHSIEGVGKITVRSQQVDDQVVMSVSDTGHGIEPEIVERIFDPFFTTKPAGKGTGLGLSISYDIISKHGGTITVESAPRVGTTFTVTLPVHGTNAYPLSNNPSV